MKFSHPKNPMDWVKEDERKKQLFSNQANGTTSEQKKILLFIYFLEKFIIFIMRTSLGISYFGTRALLLNLCVCVAHEMTLMISQNDRLRNSLHSTTWILYRLYANHVIGDCHYSITFCSLRVWRETDDGVVITQHTHTPKHPIIDSPFAQ